MINKLKFMPYFIFHQKNIKFGIRTTNLATETEIFEKVFIFQWLIISKFIKALSLTVIVIDYTYRYFLNN